MRIAIIGAGPAGAMAAVRLARAGASVTLFDPSHPREKPCGGGLTGRALALVSDVIDIHSLPAVVVKSATVEGPERSCARRADRSRRRHPDSSLLVISRAVFDRALADAAVAAGARLVPEKSRLTSPQRGTRMIVRTDRGEYEVDHVLGADGANSIVRKKLATPVRARAALGRRRLLRPRRDGVDASPSRRRASSPDTCGRFRGPIISRSASAPRRRTTPRQASCARSRRHGSSSTASIGAHGSTPYSWPIPSIGYRGRRESRRLGGAGWMLLGDAAGLVDPLTREGIYYALLSGQWAADALARDARATRRARYADRVLERHPARARPGRAPEPAVFHPGVLIAAGAGARRERRAFETCSSTWWVASSRIAASGGACSRHASGRSPRAQFGCS